MPQSFEEMLNEARPAKREPGIPLPPPWNRRDPLQQEAPILRAVIRELTYRGCWVQRIEGGAKLLHRRGQPVLAASEMTGMPDVLALREGVLFGLEVKAPGGRLGRTQLAKLQAMERAGARVAVVVGVEQLWEWIRAGAGAAGEIQGIPIIC